MNTFQSVVLSAHVMGTIAIGALIVASLAVASRRNAVWYRRLAFGLAAATAWQLVSGAALSLTTAMNSGDVLPAGAYCRNIVAYLAIIAVMQMLLYRRMHENGQAFPIQFSFASSLIGVMAALFVGAMLYL